MQAKRGKRLVRASRVWLLVIAALLLLPLSACLSGGLPIPSPDAEETPSGEPWIRVYFTDPSGPQASTLRGGPDQALAEAIDGARYSVDAAIYNLDLWSVRDALIAAHRRGVAIRVVTDSDNLLEREIEDLQEAGIPLLGDRREPLMHHKFVVIDQLDVWTGSMNLTLNGAYRNDNNLIWVRSNRMAQNYTQEFEEMFAEDRFGALSLRDTPHPEIIVDDTRLEALFSPDDGVSARLVALLEQAQTSVDFMAYAFTSDAIAAAMIERAQAGVVVRGVIEQDQAGNPGSEYERLLGSGLEVRLDGNPRNMHHKVIVIDGRIVVTGSYNFSRSAEEFNDENILIVHNVEVASDYLVEFERIFRLAEE
ncbi:MAG: phospholipase D-like domain-containing protein [Anaerolineales bacterium]|jgi:phosphatidylserine/phosphatidylglycerophosphate/cardiolipin synthase-like enzyme